ncbi:MAG TPA: fatty acid desaturase [Sandaracinaceae bacterium LLY-WYZ-13_1]|nr:fatty acid desaturase [Sandaracinaceae bacterium LLY-WYZ-13_1]
MLRYSADIRSIAFVLSYFGLLGTAYALELPWWGWVGFCVVLSLLSFFCAVITHNTVHTPVFRSRPLNSLFQIALTLTYGHPVSMYVPGHNLSHHKYTQQAKDRMRTDKMRFRWNLLNQLFFMFAVGPAIFRDNARFAKAMKRKNPKWYRQFMLETGAFAAFLLALAVLDPVKVWGLLPLKFLVFVIIPHQYAAWGIMGINFVQHDGCDGDHPYNHSRNFTGKLLNWFTFNNGFHGMHHMKPGLHWSLLPEAHAEQLAPHIHPNLDRKALLPYLVEAYVWPGKRVTYEGEPLVLPPPREDEDWMPAALKRELLDIYDADYVANETAGAT